MIHVKRVSQMASGLLRVQLYDYVYFVLMKTVNGFRFNAPRKAIYCVCSRIE